MIPNARTSQTAYTVVAAVLAAGIVAALLLLDERVPNADRFSFVLFALVGLVAGICVGRRAFNHGRAGDSSGLHVGPGILRWAVVFPMAYVLAFAAVQRILLFAFPSTSSALIEFFLGAYVLLLGAVEAACFVVSLLLTIGYKSWNNG